MLKNYPEVDELIRSEKFDNLDVSLNASGLTDVMFIRDGFKHIDVWTKDELIIDQLMQNQGKHQETIPDDIQETY